MINKPHLAHLINKSKKSKYGNNKTKVDGILFDSNAEANRYWELKMMQKAGTIQDLVLQPKFLIIDSIKWEGKTLCKRSYIADFAYTQDGVKIVEDKKGCKTDVYKIKKMLFLHKYPEYKFIET